jgi:hypothetical protein
MRSITSLALCLLTVLTLATSCSSSSRSVAADDGANVEKEYRTGKRLINETNY